MNDLELRVITAVPRDTSEIARLAGSPPEVVAFCLRRLQERGVVQCQPDRHHDSWLRDGA